MILELLRKNYDINMESITFNRKGGCVSYIINCDNEKYFLKIIDNAFLDTAIQSIDIQQYLIKNDFPVPKIINTKDNSPYFINENQLFVLYEYIDGVEPNLDDNAEKIGELVGKLHKLMSSYSGELTTHHKEFFVGRYIDILRKKHYSDKKLNEYIEIGNFLWDSVKDLPYGFCHGDLHRGNLLQVADDTIYVLDFDTACFSPQLFDIAVMCDTTDYFNFEKNEFHHTTKIFNQFMKPYSKYNQLNFDIKQFYEFIALRHYQLQATIVEIYGLDCIDGKFVDKQLDWIIQWRKNMTKFIKGLELCEGFFSECAKPIIDKYFPNLQYSAGLIGYGSDVLGYDDEVSRDHMWGPRFYMFLSENDIDKKDEIFNKFSENLQYEYMGYSVNFTEPDPNDSGVQHPQFIDSGKVNPLIFIQTFDEFLIDEIGTADLDNISYLDWLAFSEHRLLSLVSGKLFVDKLNIRKQTDKIKFYPDAVKLYLIASQLEIISSEQAFVKRCGEVSDEIGSQIICARIAERLMRLCFLYKDTYAPYSKWFGTAFNNLDIDENIKLKINAALKANDLTERENNLVEAQTLVADLHNVSGLTDKVDYNVESYFGRDIKVIFADKFVDAIVEKLNGTVFENIPLIGTMSQFGGLSSFADEKVYYEQIKRIYGV